MAAADRLAILDQLEATELCARAEATLQTLVGIMNEETTLLRAGHVRAAAALTGQKTQLAQDYVGLARTIQRQMNRLKREAPADLERLRGRHESLATQMAENLRVIATARDVTTTLLSDVATLVGKQNTTKTYSATGSINIGSEKAAGGIAINRAL